MVILFACLFVCCFATVGVFQIDTLAVRDHCCEMFNGMKLKVLAFL